MHAWLGGYGELIATTDLAPGPAKDLAQAIALHNSDSIELAGIRREESSGNTAIFINLKVQRPQQLAYPIRATEPIAIIVSPNDMRPGVFALRDDFPDTPHQNWVPEGAPCALCIDDRPWPEAKLSYTPLDFLQRIELWLSKAARGELHDPSQPPDPIFLRSGDAVLMPAEALVDAPEPIELSGFFRIDNPGFIITQKAGGDTSAFAVVSYQLPPQSMPRMRRAPRTLGQLARELEKSGIDLLSDLKSRLRGWAGIKSENARRLGERLIIVVQFPTTGAGRTANDVRAFLTRDDAGSIGVALGVIEKNNIGQGFVQRIVPKACAASDLDIDIDIFPAQVHLLLNRELAASISGHPRADRRSTVLVGAGSLGSQLSMNLAREGMFDWTVIDDDTLLPHNLARHALPRSALAAPKAFALARELSELLGEPFVAYRCDALNPSQDVSDKVAESLRKAELIIDASASVAASRHLSDLPNVTARRVCAFFNPSGTAAVLLVEDAQRTVTLRDLEAQYHRLVLTEPSLEGHLREKGDGVRYSGSCRALTNRIPATGAALLSALVSRGIMDAVDRDGAEIRIWTCKADDAIDSLRVSGKQVFSMHADDWIIHYDQGLLNELAALRASRLPSETGGVLLGVVDMSRKSIHITHGLPEPPDSEGSVSSFERGVVHLADDINKAIKSTMHQLRYVGEWHSHPRRSPSIPSGKDLVQLLWLESELRHEELPGLMLIAADHGAFSLVIKPNNLPEIEELTKQNAAG